ncbi:Alpha-1-6-mannosyltransferase subunit (Ecm39) [Penicillium chermesinum]|nr:Alpha-1-6-mannosyltransferase subunit (Ecm39) [Penicillium chermesinum]
MKHGLGVALLVLLLAALIVLHAVVAPYTKVEESFHVQATHDILAFGLPYEKGLEYVNYDHFVFPGAVPRTAVGAAALAKVSQGLLALNVDIDHQILSRVALGLYNALALGVFAHGVLRSFGRTVAVWYLVLQGSQFHLIYYASRPLSNMFAFGLTTFSLRFALPDKLPLNAARSGLHENAGQLSLILLTFAGRITLLSCIKAGLLGLSLGLCTTFWQRWPLWPELEAFVFNVVHGQSSEWGIEPWSFYFLNALPRLLLNPATYLLALPIALRQPATRHPALSLLTPSLTFVALYSFMPHKEWRFIIYIIPALTASAALGAGYLWTHRARSLFARTASRLLVLSTLFSFLLSTFVLLPASAANYPGAHALNALHRYHARTAPVQDTDVEPDSVTVYLGNLACQTGVTRFLQLPDSHWVYDKTEDEAAKASFEFWDRFDYALVEAGRDPTFADDDEGKAQWEVVEVVDGFAGVSVLRPGVQADGDAERWVLRSLGGESAAGLYERGRDIVRQAVLRGWWVELKMRPKIKVLKRV